MADEDNETKRLIDELQASQERFRQVVDLSPNAIFLHRDSIIISMNPAGLKLFGATEPQQIIGQSLWNLYPPERHGIVRSRNQSMERSKQMAPLVEHTVLRIDGVRLNVEATACLIDYEGLPTFIVNLRDITERKKTKMLLDLQYAVSRSLIEAENFLEASNHVLEAICNNLKFDVSRIWIFDKKDQVLRYVASWTLENDLDEVANKLGHKSALQKEEDLPGKVLVTQESAWEETTSYYKLRIAVPILNAKEVMGVIECFNKISLPRDEVVLQTLLGAGDQIGLFLKRKLFEKDLAYLARHDPITGLSNRLFFEETLAYEINLAKGKDQILSVIFVDINAFNSINEAMGHAAGDVLLKDIGSRLMTLQIPNQNIGRFGPQFALILTAVQQTEGVSSFIDQINHIIENEFNINDQKVSVIFNYGIAMYPEDGKDVPTLLRSASIALTRAKEIGGGAVQFCTADLNLRAQRRVKLENDLRSALTNQEFALYYQPIVETATMLTEGFESLIRWQKNGEIVNPSEFISLAEKSHLIIPLGEWSVRTACRQCALWNKTSKQAVFVSVNISAVQFKNSDVIAMLGNILHETGLNPSCLKIELTESVLMENVHKSINTLRAIKDMGVKISIDDFGTGYSSLNYLRHLPIDYLKIDQSFVRNMTTDTNDAAIVKTIIDLAHNLNYKVIAEGVETLEQVNFLTTLGCIHIQGYYFSPPLPITDATAFLQQGKLLK